MTDVRDGVDGPLPLGAQAAPHQQLVFATGQSVVLGASAESAVDTAAGEVGYQSVAGPNSTDQILNTQDSLE